MISQVQRSLVEEFNKISLILTNTLNIEDANIHVGAFIVHANRAIALIHDIVDAGIGNQNMIDAFNIKENYAFTIKIDEYVKKDN